MSKKKCFLENHLRACWSYKLAPFTFKWILNLLVRSNTKPVLEYRTFVWNNSLMWANRRQKCNKSYKLDFILTEIRRVFKVGLIHCQTGTLHYNIVHITFMKNRFYSKNIDNNNTYRSVKWKWRLGFMGNKLVILYYQSSDYKE